MRDSMSGKPLTSSRPSSSDQKPGSIIYSDVRRSTRGTKVVPLSVVKRTFLDALLAADHDGVESYLKHKEIEKALRSSWAMDAMKNAGLSGDVRLFNRMLEFPELVDAVNDEDFCSMIGRRIIDFTQEILEVAMQYPKFLQGMISYHPNILEFATENADVTLMKRLFQEDTIINAIQLDNGFKRRLQNAAMKSDSEEMFDLITSTFGFQFYHELTKDISQNLIQPNNYETFSQLIKIEGVSDHLTSSQTMNCALEENNRRMVKDLLQFDSCKQGFENSPAIDASDDAWMDYFMKNRGLSSTLTKAARPS